MLSLHILTLFTSSWVVSSFPPDRSLVSDSIMGDRFNILSQMEHLQSKYMGTGHADTSKFEWAVHQHRDTFSSLLGHQDLTNYLAIAENESKARVKFNMLEKMLQPCGPPPEKKYED